MSCFGKLNYLINLFSKISFFKIVYFEQIGYICVHKQNGETVSL